MYPDTAHRAGGPVPASTTHTAETGVAAHLLEQWGGVDGITKAVDRDLHDGAVCGLEGPHSGPITVTVTTGGEGLPADFTTVSATAPCTDPRCCARAHADAFLQEMEDALRTAGGYLERISSTVLNAEDPAAAWRREAVTTGTVLRQLVEAVEPHAGPRPLTRPDAN